MRDTCVAGQGVRYDRIVVLAATALLILPGPVRGQQATRSTDTPQAQTAPAAATARVFGSDAGIVLNFVKPDKAADFETVMAKLKDALMTSSKPERRQQLAGWKVYRALEPGVNGSVLYVFVIQPAVPGADYTVSTILAEAFPNDVQALYRQYAESYASGQNILNLKLVGAPAQ